MNQIRRNFWAGVIGNLLDRFDMALYGVMAPFIAPNFFPDDDPMASLIKTYGVMALGMFTRPLGALLFGSLAMRVGAKKVLIICLVGVALCTGMLGLIPSHDSIGNSATFIFIVVRVFQGVFASGENTVAPFFIIKNSSSEQATRTSGYYNCSTMTGVIMASVFATIVSYSSEPAFYWRYAFIFGFFTALAGIFLRMTIVLEAEQLIPKISIGNVFAIVAKHKISVLRIILVGSFSYITYTVPFVFMNNFVPQITNITLGEMLQLNSILLVMDTALIPVFGLLAENFNRSKFMGSMSALIAVTAIPLFYFLDGSSFIYIMFVRLVIIIGGLAYLAPIYAWYYDLVDEPDRYIVVGVGYSIGEEILGRNSTAICLWLWYYFKNPVAPAFYIVAVAILASLALTARWKKE